MQYLLLNLFTAIAIRHILKATSAKSENKHPCDFPLKQFRMKLILNTVVFTFALVNLNFMKPLYGNELSRYKCIGVYCSVYGPSRGYKRDTIAEELGQL